jgi:hypothetical protein
MSTHLSRHFKERRLALRLRPGELVRLCGYTKIAKWANRLQMFEERGTVERELLRRLQVALEIDHQTVSALIRQDQHDYLQAWLQWVNEPVPMCVRICRAPLFVPSFLVPEEISTQEEAERWACEQAKQLGPLTLHVNRKVSVAIDGDGQVTGRHESSPDTVQLPYQQIGRHRFRFVFGPNGMTIETETRPQAIEPK